MNRGLEAKYVAGGNTTIHGVTCKGSLRALNPATGAFSISAGILYVANMDGKLFAFGR
jgi:hypothetical protein